MILTINFDKMTQVQLTVILLQEGFASSSKNSSSCPFRDIKTVSKAQGDGFIYWKTRARSKTQNVGLTMLLYGI